MYLKYLREIPSRLTFVDQTTDQVYTIYEIP
jgi:hypothetical protein